MGSAVRVLLVDEDASILDITETFLEREDEDFDVETVTSVEAAIEQVESESFDVIVSDYKMPHMNGVELAEEVAERVDLPYFLFTAREGREFQAEVDDAPVDGYIQKGTGTEQYAELAEKIRDAV